MEIQPPATHWAEDLMTTMQRGDMDGSSFGFQAIRDRWGTGTSTDGQTIDERWVLEAKLFDVSVVTYPAYPQSEAQVRSLFAAAGFDVDALARAVVRAQRQLPLAARDREILRAAVDQFRAYLPDDQVASPVAPVPVQTEDHPAAEQPSAPVPTGHPLSYYRHRLDLLEAKIR